jgi:hypothetical protein
MSIAEKRGMPTQWESRVEQLFIINRNNLLTQNLPLESDMVAHAYNPSYSGG